MIVEEEAEGNVLVPPPSSPAAATSELRRRGGAVRERPSDLGAGDGGVAKERRVRQAGMSDVPAPSSAPAPFWGRAWRLSAAQHSQRQTETDRDRDKDRDRNRDRVRDIDRDRDRDRDRPTGRPATASSARGAVLVDLATVAAWDAGLRVWAAPRTPEEGLRRPGPGGSLWCRRQAVPTSPAHVAPFNLQAGRTD